VIDGVEEVSIGADIPPYILYSNANEAAIGTCNYINIVRERYARHVDTRGVADQLYSIHSTDVHWIAESLIQNGEDGVRTLCKTAKEPFREQSFADTAT
jgi:hypothetical protein